ncbi:MAG: PEP-CTERM sorting domain-containing protein, partial [Phycisphaerae bacterium]|nr:PEP-CTERM sorting domain-containing protein [Phycisphaerae bacterium]
ELGDYSITNGGTVSAQAFLFVTNIDIPVNPPNNPIVQQASGTPTFPLTVAQPNSASGQWSHVALANLPNGWRRLQIVLNNILQASTPQGGTAVIEKKVGGITITLIPEPGMIGAALAGLGALLIRRRK